ncbi:glycosyltransferase family 1 protein [candidate division WOR-3 bacterium]|uniref:Glycosyltransferase family 1 protein n=1 Tax=candidate division WOR-3 bacterium TaxID=2052148 RepID=A0A937XFK6_UNCW3|nr:glycosyltransferase family 1 protein [candidate division WOR-3 bacterium]
MIRVLQVIGTTNVGGAETRVLEFAATLNSSEYHLDFCAFGPDPGAYDDRIRGLGFGITHCRVTRNILESSERFRLLLRDGRYDIIHCHVNHLSGIHLRAAAKEGVPLRIQHWRGANSPRPGVYWHWASKLLMAWTRRYATRIVAVSEGAMEAYMGAEWQRDPRATILYNGIDPQPFLVRYDRAETLSEFGIPLAAHVVIHVGSFLPAKNHEMLISVVQSVAERHGSVHFLLVGDGPLFGRIRSRVTDGGLEGSVHFAGLRRDVPRLLQASDCLLLPSKSEGLPGAVLEALAAGLPVVASDIGPLREIARESERVSLVPPGDAAAFADGVLTALAGQGNHTSRTGSIPPKFRFGMYVERMLGLYESRLLPSDRARRTPDRRSA